MLGWWAIEYHAANHELILDRLIQNMETWNHPTARQIIYPNLIRRWSTMGTPAAYDAVSRLLIQIGRLAPDRRSEASQAAQEAFEQAFVGRSLAGVPDSLIDALVALGQPTLTLQVRRGDEAALVEASQRIADPSTADPIRIQLTRLVGELPHARVRSDLLDALLFVSQDEGTTPALRASALSALAGFDSERIADTIVNTWPTLPTELRSTAGAVLAARPNWTGRWLDACEQQRLVPSELPPESIRAMRMHPSESLQKRIAFLYPEFASIDLAAANARSREAAERILAGNGDPYRGKKLYRDLCGRCHRLFDDGGAVGPDLTGYQRDQLETLLRNILAPSLEIREGYQMVRVLTEDAMVLSGFVENQTGDQVILRSIDGQLHTLETGTIETIQPQILSLMPEGLLDKLDETQLCDLMAYLRSSQPLNDGS
jgi:putative heme-binding domain-containing protein